jgi:hypothetical protein
LIAVNAGNMGPLIRRSDGRVEAIGERQGGLPLGIDAGQSSEAVRTSLGSGDVVVLYTDGINEAMDREDRQFGFESFFKTDIVLLGHPYGARRVRWCNERQPPGCDDEGGQRTAFLKGVQGALSCSRILTSSSVSRLTSCGPRANRPKRRPKSWSRR